MNFYSWCQKRKKYNDFSTIFGEIILGGQAESCLYLGSVVYFDTHHSTHLNGGVVQHQKTSLKRELPAEERLLIQDEIHKYKHWRNLGKGFYD
jgi:hypothetical protein